MKNIICRKRGRMRIRRMVVVRAAALGTFIVAGCGGSTSADPLMSWRSSPSINIMSAGCRSTSESSSPINIGMSAGRRSITANIASIPRLMARSTLAVRKVSLHNDISQSEVRLASSAAVKTKKRKKKTRYNNSGFYYGIREELMMPYIDNEDTTASTTTPSPIGEEGAASDTPRQLLGGTPGVGSDNKVRRPPGGTKQRRPIRRSSATLTEIMGETLLELKEMREEVFQLREELKAMKQQMWTTDGGDEDIDEFEDDESAISSQQSLLAEEAENIYMPEHHEHPQQQGLGGLLARRKRHKMFDNIGRSVERWADRLFFEETCNIDTSASNGEENGWKEIKCNRVVRQKYNSEGRFQCFLKWMPDSREEDARTDDGGREYPCICVKGTIDAPIEHVCDYLSRKEHMAEYNELVCAHRDLEVISPHGKITWGQCPQILFVKPRDFVTYCHHRWKRDGTLVIVNQACEHEDAPGVDTDKGGKVCRAFALRGANYFSKAPNDESKTQFYLLAHADPGGGLPQWACKSAVNAVAPIEPFKLFHNIEQCVKSKGAPPPRTGFAAALPGRSSRPAGVSQMGYACFWPEGGGLKDHHHTAEQQEGGEPSGEALVEARGGSNKSEGDKE